MIKPKAYSYQRFSTPEQQKGTSIERQTGLAERYAEANGLDLVKSRTFYDLGVSAFRGTNLSKGSLGILLDLARDGIIKPGDYLLVEAFDRLSRENPYDSFFTVRDICSYGIIIVTLFDEQLYSAQRFKSDPSALAVAIGILGSGHNESLRKSKRGIENWKIKRNDYNSSRVLLTAQTVEWVRLDKQANKFDLIPERVSIVQRIFDDYLSGIGYASIATNFNKEGIQCWGRGARRGKFWYRTYISKILKNRAVLGEYTAHIIHHLDDKKIRVPEQTYLDYYPRIISDEQFALAQERLARKKNYKPSNAVNYIFHGLAFCPLCGGTLTRKNYGANKKSGADAMVCVNRSAKAGCTFENLSLDKVERFILDNIVFIVKHIPDPVVLQIKQSDIDKYEIEYNGLLLKINNLTTALSEEFSKTIANAIRDLESQADELHKKISKIRQLAERGRDEVFNFRKLEVIDYFAKYDGNRQRANDELHKLFSSIVVHYSYCEFYLKLDDAFRNPITPLRYNIKPMHGVELFDRDFRKSRKSES